MPGHAAPAPSDFAFLEKFAACRAADFPAGGLQHGSGWRQHDLVRGRTDQVGGKRIDFDAQLLAFVGILAAGFRQHDESFRRCAGVRAAEYSNTAGAYTGDIADGFFQFMGIDVAPRTDDYVLDAPGDINLAIGNVGQVSGIQPVLVEKLSGVVGVTVITAGAG